tara:strand:+ start:137 stop:337 length:201 start_codon:yes stop_codon:yes gene_type:complete
MGKNTHKTLTRKPTIQIEMNDSFDGNQLHTDQMSPVNATYKNAVQKMGAVGNETKWPRNDNFYMGK